MTSIEHQLREELRRTADQVQPGQLRPLRAPKRARRWLPVAAVGTAGVATSIAIGIAVATGAAPVSRQSTVPPSADSSMPRYYMTVQDVSRQLTATVRDSSTGKVTGTVVVADQSSVCGWQIAGAADDQHFVINDITGCDLPGSSDGTLYTLTVAADGRPSQPVKLAEPADQVTGMGLSPDGSMLALSQLNGSPLNKQPYGGVEVVNLVTGATSTLSLRSEPGYWPGLPQWSDGNRVVSVPWWHSTTAYTAGADVVGVRQFAVSGPGQTLHEGTLRLLPTPIALSSALVVNGGETIIGSVCTQQKGQPDAATARVDELSLASPPIIHQLRAQSIRNRDAGDAVQSQCSVLSADPGGQHVLIQAFTFGRLDNGTFTPLPGLTPRIGFVAAAW